MMLKWVEELVSQLMFLFTGVMVLACFGILAVAAIIEILRDTPSVYTVGRDRSGD